MVIAEGTLANILRCGESAVQSEFSEQVLRCRKLCLEAPEQASAAQDSILAFAYAILKCARGLDVGRLHRAKDEQAWNREAAQGTWKSAVANAQPQQERDREGSHARLSAS